MRYPTKNTPFEWQESPDILRFKITPYKIDRQSSGDASRNGIDKTKAGDDMIFLAPLTFQENTIHEWANYDSLGTRFVQKVNQLQKLTKDITTQAKSVATNGKSGKVITQKLDTPLTFSDSNRRTLNLTFQLVDQGDTETDVFAPVRLLQQYSCAEKGEGFNFQFPYIFTVQTMNSDLVYIENAALGSVQPTWLGPFRNGYPSRCELTLEFKDIEPLYRETYI